MAQESQSNQYSHIDSFEEVNTIKFNEQIQSLEGSVIIELFEIDTAKYGGQVYRFHAGKVIQGDITFASQTYQAYSLEVEDFEIRGDGALPRPKIVFANTDGFISNIINGKDDFVGLKVKRIRTFLKYLDEVNFVDNINPYGTPDETVKFPDEKYFINKKIVEDKNVIEFELVSELELESAKLPARTVYANYCPWIYRGNGCHYGNKDVHPKSTWLLPTDENILGQPVADADNNRFRGEVYGFSTGGNAPWQGNLSSPFANSGSYDATGIYASGDYVTIQSTESDEIKLYFVAKPTGKIATEFQSAALTFFNVSGKDPRYDADNWVQDQCSKNLSGCLLRFANTNKGLPYGGFPGVERFPYG
tara:strand:- start:7521 stop:8606 length:1086 start_codon:yes stop_codon:yes gene_type:complete